MLLTSKIMLFTAGKKKENNFSHLQPVQLVVKSMSKNDQKFLLIIIIIIIIINILILPLIFDKVVILARVI